MLGLAFRSLRHRAAAFKATFVAVLLGTALMGSFAGLAETATGPVPDIDAETLTIMGMVVGAWGSVIVLFSVASMLGLTVRQRDAETGLLRTVGATPRQVRRLVRLEALAVSAVAALLGAVLAAGGGRLLLAMLRDAHMVGPDVEFGGGVAALGTTVAAVVLTSLVAASVVGHRATRGPARGVLREAGADTGRMRWWRVLLAVLLIGYGVVMAVVTVMVTAHAEDPYAAMGTAGSSSILVGTGLALLGPLLLRRAGRLVRVLPVHGGVAGELATSTASRRPYVLAGLLGPVMVLSAAATGTLMLVGIDARTLTVSGVGTEDAATITLLNNVVVGMISLFAAIMVFNTFAAVVAGRREELRRLWVLGATPAQVRRSVGAEAALVAVVGVLAGFVASLTTVVPFAVARHEGVVPDGQLWLPPLVALAVVVLTLLAARFALRRVGLGGNAHPGAVRAPR